MPEPTTRKSSELISPESRLSGLERQLERMGSEVIQADYRVMRLTQEVRRGRKVFGFLTGFQNSISRAESIGALYDIALKAIVAELWLKRAVVLECEETGDALQPTAHLGYSPNALLDTITPDSVDPEWISHSRLVNGETESTPAIERIREALDLPYFVWMPLLKDNRVVAVLVSGTLEEDRAQQPPLTEHDLELFESISAILWVGRMNLLARRRLQRQLRYESLLHDVSDLLLQDLNAPTEHFNEVLSRVGTAWSLDRVRLLEWKQEGDGAIRTSEWRAGGVNPASSDDEPYPLEDMPRWHEAMLRGETIRIDDVDELPDDEQVLLEFHNIRSLLVIPVTAERTLVGWVSFEQCASRCTWSNQDISLLDVIAGLLSRAIAQRREIEARKLLEAEYHHSQKMEAVGQLAGGIAHDFNNLLTTIQGYAQLLTRRLPEELREMPGLREIAIATEKAAGLTRQLLTFSRRETAATGAVHLNTVISDMMSLLSRTLGEHITVDIDLAPNLVDIVGDSQQVSQMMMNLALNARDAMPEGGTLRISTSEALVNRETARRLSFPGIERCQIIEVTDTGTGMNRETRERIFEPFFTTKEAGRGTGLGLAIVFSVVRQHGGFIDVSSEEGEGATFRIYLPVRTPGRKGEQEKVSAVQGGHETILVVEDDDGVRTMISEVLSAQGYHIVTAKNGKEAIQHVSHLPGEVSLVMTDIVMPQMGGREMCERLQTMGFDTPVIAMSGFPKDEDGSQWLDDIATYLQKPFGPKDITRTVRRILDSPHTPARQPERPQPH